MMTILQPILEQHISEAGFLWGQRGFAVVWPHFSPRELALLEERIEAHLDGILIAGEEGWEIVQARLAESQDAGDMFVAAYCTISSNPTRLNELLTMAENEPKLIKGIAGAFAWHDSSWASKAAASILSRQHPVSKLLGLRVCLAHHLNPGLALEKCLFDSDLPLRSAALQLVGMMGYAAWTKHLKSELRSPDLGCRFAAAWSLARLSNDAAALAELQTIALAESTYRIPALNILVRRLEPGAVRKLIGILSKIPGAERLVLFAMGVWGDPVDVPYLLEKMNVTPHARIAAESFSFITGLNLTDNNFDGSTPADHEPVPNEDPLDDRVELDPDENLPWPVVNKVQDWWNKNHARFQPGTRYLVGEPLSETRCNKVVIEGYQRQRAYAALELALKNPGQPIIDITGRTK